MGSQVGPGSSGRLGENGTVHADEGAGRHQQRRRSANPLTAVADGAGQWLHRLPRVPVVRKDEFLKQLVSGKRIVHAGFSGRNEGALAVPVWVHGELAETAKEIIGLDLDEKGIQEARAAGYNAFAVDCQDPVAVANLGLSVDLVVAGELIEHLDSPGMFLTSMRQLSDALVITTPNAYSMINFASVLTSRELIHPDHVALYSWYTLSHLLSRHGWQPEQVVVYKYETVADGDRPLGKRMANASLQGLQWLLTRYQPFFAHGLIMVCRATEDAP